MADTNTFQTADISDEHPEKTSVAESMFRGFGERKSFSGPMATLKLFEDNTLVREVLSEPGEGRVLVVDGGGSKRCALVGDRIAELARDNGWAGILVYGCIRDSMIIDKMDIGVYALGTSPKKSIKQGRGDKELNITFAGVTFVPGHYVYVDGDGVLVSPESLL